MTPAPRPDTSAYRDSAAAPGSYDATHSGDAALPLVSVVIPCYKQAHFLAEAIESVLTQSYGTTEIIVVDDGSPDDTAAVAARFPMVRYVVQENRGLAEARNTGMAHARGELLVFLDADDRLLPDALATGVGLMTADPSLGFVAGYSRFITGDGTPLPTGQPVRQGGDAYTALLRRNSIRNPAMVMFRKSALAVTGGFDPRVPACADYQMYLRVSREFPVRFYTDVVAEYRKHGENMSLNAALMLRQLQEVLRQQRPFLTTPERQLAFRQGCRNVGDFYGDRLATQIRGRFRARSGWLPMVRDIATFVVCEPRVALRHAFRKFGVWRRGGVSDAEPS